MEMLPREAKEAKTEQWGMMWGDCKERPTVNLGVSLFEAALSESCSRQAMEDMEGEGMSGLTEINIIKHWRQTSWRRPVALPHLGPGDARLRVRIWNDSHTPSQDVVV